MIGGSDRVDSLMSGGWWQWRVSEDLCRIGVCRLHRGCVHGALPGRISIVIGLVRLVELIDLSLLQQLHVLLQLLLFRSKHL